MLQFWMFKMSGSRSTVLLRVVVIISVINHISASTSTPPTIAILATTATSSPPPPPTTTTTKSTTSIGATTAQMTTSATTDGDDTTNSDTSTSSTNVTSEMPPSTTTVEMTTATTTMAPEFLSHNLGTALYTLAFTVGPTNSSDFQYKDINMTESEILETMEQRLGGMSSNIRLERSMRVEGFILSLDFFRSKINNQTQKEIEDKLDDLNADPFSLTNSTIVFATVDKFINATHDICQATNVCPTGFTCTEDGCEHMCKTETCSMHGTCVVRVLANKRVGTMCNCDVTFDTEYSGEHCEDSRMGKEKIVAIVAGVLGGLCALLIIILIVLIICFIQARKKRRDIILRSADYFSSTYYNTPTGVDNYGMENVNGNDPDQWYK